MSVPDITVLISLCGILLPSLTPLLRSQSNSCPQLTTGNGVYKCTGSQLSDVPAFPGGVTTVDLSDNNIYLIHEDSFKALTNLRRLILDNNKLWKITEKAFNNLGKLEELSLKNNALVIHADGLRASAFSRLGNLRRLYLSGNPLGVIPDGFFHHLTNLTVLEVEKAVKGLRIEPRAFQNLNRLRQLSLANNMLTRLPPKFSEDFSRMNLKRLYLDGNRWICDCNLKWLIRWYIKNNKTNPIITNRMGQQTLYTALSPNCTAPARLHRRYLFRIPLMEFECEPRVYSESPRHVTAYQHDNLTLTCDFYTEPKSFVRWIKDGTYIHNDWDRFTTRTTPNSTRFLANLTISNLQQTDAGLYKCETGNKLGTASANITLEVQQARKKVLKMQKIVILIGIAASGLVVLLAAIGIIVYCFYGRDPHKYQNSSPTTTTTTTTNNNNTILGGKKRQLAASTHDGEVTARLTDNQETKDEESDHGTMESRSVTTPRKRVFIASPVSQPVPTSQDLLSLRAQSPPLDFAATDATAMRQQTPGRNNDCPVHGNRLSYSPCPVHGSTLQRSQPQPPPAHTNPHYNTLQPQTSHQKDCPLHGGASNYSSLQRHSHQPQSILRSTNIPVSFARASQVDDCLTPPPPPPHGPKTNSLASTTGMVRFSGAISPPPQTSVVEDPQRLERSGFCYAVQKSQQNDDGYSTAV